MRDPQVFHLTGFSAVPGDEAYVEALDELGAVTRLWNELKTVSLSKAQPVTSWTVTKAVRPLLIVHWRD